MEGQAADERVVEVIRENPKYFFKYAQSKAKIKTPVGLLKDSHVLVENDQGMCELLGSKFDSVFSNPHSTRGRRMISKFSRSCQVEWGRRTLSLDQKM
jgi:hypothetical protein